MMLGSFHASNALMTAGVVGLALMAVTALGPSAAARPTMMAIAANERPAKYFITAAASLDSGIAGARRVPAAIAGSTAPSRSARASHRTARSPVDDRGDLRSLDEHVAVQQVAVDDVTSRLSGRPATASAWRTPSPSPRGHGAGSGWPSPGAEVSAPIG